MLLLTGDVLSPMEIEMTQIRFATGNFLQFTATRTFALSSGIKVSKGSELEFDGSTVNYAGMPSAMPQLRSAITAGWLVLSEDYEEGNPEYGIRTSAQIQVRPAVSDATSLDGSSARNSRTVSTVTQHDERVVLNSREHAASTKAQNGFQKVAVTTSGGQEGVAVRTLSTPSKQRTELTASSVGSAIRAATDGVPQIVPGQGITQEEMLERMDPEEAEKYLAKKASRRSALVADEPAPVVARVKNRSSKQTEGMKLTQSVGGGLEIGDDGPVVAKIKSSDVKTTRVEDGITFTNTNVPDKAQKASKLTASQEASATPEISAEVRLRIAKAMCPDFPASYDFSAPAKKKLARLQADFEDRLDILRAVFAAESDTVRAQLVEEFPDAFNA